MKSLIAFIFLASIPAYSDIPVYVIHENSNYKLYLEVWYQVAPLQSKLYPAQFELKLLNKCRQTIYYLACKESFRDCSEGSDTLNQNFDFVLDFQSATNIYINSIRPGEIGYIFFARRFVRRGETYNFKLKCNGILYPTICNLWRADYSFEFTRDANSFPSKNTLSNLLYDDQSIFQKSFMESEPFDYFINDKF